MYNKIRIRKEKYYYVVEYLERKPTWIIFGEKERWCTLYQVVSLKSALKCTIGLSHNPVLVDNSALDDAKYFS